MATAPDEACATKLVGVTGGGYTLVASTNVFPGAMVPEGPGVPLVCVFCLATGGPINRPRLGVGKDEKVMTVQVMVRGEPLKMKEAQALARACRTALHRASVTATPFVGYTYVYVREPQPFEAKQDANGCHLFTFNVQLELVE